MKTRVLPAALVVACLALSACKSDEQKAEDYYQSGLELLQAGDEERALVEFKNVFKYDGFHKEARQTYADVLLAQGDVQGAYSQYLRLVEQYPNTVDVRLILAETALSRGNWPEVERHGQEAIRLAPDDARARAVKLALDYRAGVMERDDDARALAAQEAAGMIAANPENLVLRRIVIDFAMSGQTPESALPLIEDTLALSDGGFEFYAMKLKVLNDLGDEAAIGDTLKEMVRLFPDNVERKQDLIRWYLRNKDLAGAERFLRGEAGDDPTQNPELHLAVVQFLNTYVDRAAGRADVDRLIAATQGTDAAPIYGAYQARMMFDDGDKNDAIASLGAIIARSDMSDQTRDLMALQARMYDEVGARASAQALVTKVLQADAGNVDALKLKASWAIENDDPGQAIIDLRTALNQAPFDSSVMTLLAAAHERDGSFDLAGEQLAKAVAASGSASEEALRYAEFLRKQGRIKVAETVLVDARKSSPANTDVLRALGEVLLTLGKWTEVQGIIEELSATGDEDDQQVADRFRAAALLGQNRFEEGLAVLEAHADQSGDVGAIAAVIATQIRAGHMAEASATLKQAKAENPGNRDLRLIEANLAVIQGDAPTAEVIYRELITVYPEDDTAVDLLFRLYAGLGEMEAAERLVDEGLSRLPDSRKLLFFKAGLLEEDDQFDAAIEVYQKLYDLDTTSMIAANNLASMIATHRDDAASLELAQAVARRFRGSDVPQFQDTYGWIEYRRGNLEEALRYLEPAAQVLTSDPLTQFHLARVYDDLGRTAEAITQYEKALSAGEGRVLPQLREAATRMKALKAAQ